MKFVRSGWSGWAAVAAIALAAPATAGAQERQVSEGTIVYVEEADGSLSPHRRIDDPDEGDGRARLAPISEAQVPRGGQPTAYLVVPRTAVIGPVSTAQADVDVDMGAIETRAAAGKADTDVRVQAPEMRPERPSVRPRVGIMALGGGQVNDVEGWLVGGALQLGVQLGDWFAIYYQPTALYAAIDPPGGGSDDDIVADDTDDAFTLWNPLIFELTLFDVVSLGAGPSVDIYEECEANAACAQDDVYFGAHGRVALNLGGIGEMGRHAVQLSFEVHPTWFDFGDSDVDEDSVMSVAMLGGLGVQLY